MLKLRWLGTAAFEVYLKRTVILIDPYLSRSVQARPTLTLCPAEVTRANFVFLTHGHFDHALDTPLIAQQTGAMVYASAPVCDVLRRQGVPDTQLRPLAAGDEVCTPGFTVRAIASLHVRFDWALIVRTLLKAGPRISASLRLLRDYPQGDVLGYLFTLVNGFTFCHFGSAGYYPEQIRNLCPDLALIPVAGHSDIGRIAAEMTALIRPKLVIPHHHDDFYPPISHKIPLQPFYAWLRTLSPEVQVRELAVGETWEAAA